MTSRANGLACDTCAHRYWQNRRDPTKCAAYPLGIPREIYPGGDPHTEPFEGDGGIRYLWNGRGVPYYPGPEDDEIPIEVGI